MVKGVLLLLERTKTEVRQLEELVGVMLFIIVYCLFLIYFVAKNLDSESGEEEEEELDSMDCGMMIFI